MDKGCIIHIHIQTIVIEVQITTLSCYDMLYVIGSYSFFGVREVEFCYFDVVLSRSNVEWHNQLNCSDHVLCVLGF
jgi:hypothetical protein